MATEEESAVSSLVGSVVSEISTNGEQIFDKALLEKLKISLARDAAEKSVLMAATMGSQLSCLLILDA
jgi:hypothetical protein